MKQGDYFHSGYKFIDKSRFKLVKLSSPFIAHTVYSNFSHQINGVELALIALSSDTPQCKNTRDTQEKRGQAFYWAPEDYHNFTKALLRSEKLV